MPEETQKPENSKVVYIEEWRRKRNQRLNSDERPPAPPPARILRETPQAGEDRRPA